AVGADLAANFAALRNQRVHVRVCKSSADSGYDLVKLTRRELLGYDGLDVFRPPGAGKMSVGGSTGWRARRSRGIVDARNVQHRAAHPQDNAAVDPALADVPVGFSTRALQ